MAVDRAHVWHPFTQMKEHLHAPPLPVARAEGCDLVLVDGRRIFDGVSSWWTCIHGHGHPRIANAIAQQAATLDHVMFAGFTHEPAVELVARLRPRLPPLLTRAFFSDNGSTSVEVALKMTFQAHAQRGHRARDRIGALRGAYHGDTLGAVGVGELRNFLTEVFAPLLLRCERIEVPSDPRVHVSGASGTLDLDAARAHLRAYFAEHGERLSAFVVEPLVQGAGGMHMWPVELLADLRALCTNYDVYLIFDEVMTGFGRTGTFFALDQAGVVPDVLCLSKGLTGGTLPLALTITGDALFDVFWGEPEEAKAFLHGHSYTANPIACAAAAASLAIFDETPVLAHAGALAERLRSAWSRLADHPGVCDVRTLGAIAACTLVGPQGGPRENLAREGLTLHLRAIDRGLLIRPIGACLYLMPPLATPLEKVDEAVDTLLAIL
jgi:adenosylmethionine-8-amino-7-oxononanoate aminotransferase